MNTSQISQIQVIQEVVTIFQYLRLLIHAREEPVSSGSGDLRQRQR